MEVVTRKMATRLKVMTKVRLKVMTKVMEAIHKGHLLATQQALAWHQTPMACHHKIHMPKSKRFTNSKCWKRTWPNKQMSRERSTRLKGSRWRKHNEIEKERRIPKRRWIGNWDGIKKTISPVQT